MQFNSGLKNKLVMTTAIVAAFAGYGRRAYAGCYAAPAGSSTYSCSGSGGQQTITANNATVTTMPGFSAAGGIQGVLMTGGGILSFTDLNQSTLSGVRDGITVQNGASAVNITIGDGSTLTGGQDFGIFVTNSAAGGINVNIGASTITGGAALTGADSGSSAIFLVQSSGSGDIIFKSAVGSIVTDNGPNSYVMSLAQKGTGGINQVLNGTFTGVSQGIATFILNQASTGALTIVAEAGSSITAGQYGLHGFTLGSGDVNITANGNITAGTSSSTSRGISGGAYFGNSGAVNITTGAGSNTTGSFGIYGYNSGKGALTITANGNVTGVVANGLTGLNLTSFAGAPTSQGGTDQPGRHRPERHHGGQKRRLRWHQRHLCH